jgi:hypothetical protein
MTAISYSPTSGGNCHFVTNSNFLSFFSEKKIRIFRELYLDRVKFPYKLYASKWYMEMTVVDIVVSHPILSSVLRQAFLQMPGGMTAEGSLLNPSLCIALKDSSLILG